MNNKIFTQLTIIVLSFFLESPAMKNEDVYTPDKIYDKSKDSKIIFARINMENKIKLQNQRNFKFFSDPTPLTFFLSKWAYTPTENIFAAIVERSIKIVNQKTQESYSCSIVPYEGAKHSIHKQEHSPLCIAFSYDGKIIAGGYEHTYQSHLPVPTIQLYNAQNGQQITEFGASNDYVHSLAYSQNSNLLASGSKSGNIIIWNVNELNDGVIKEEATLNKNAIEIRDLIFTPDSTQLISASNNQEINIWNLLAKECLLTLTTQSNVQALAFHPTKKHLLAFLDDKKICFWNNLYQKYLKNE